MADKKHSHAAASDGPARARVVESTDIKGDFKKISSFAAGDVSFSWDDPSRAIKVTAEIPVKISISDGELSVRGSAATNISVSDNGIVVIGGVSGGSYVNIGGVVISGGGVNHGGISISNFNGKTFVNGVDISNLKSASRGEEEKGMSKEWFVTPNATGCVRKVEVCGAGSVIMTNEAATACLSKDLSFSVSGSGAILIPATAINRLSAKLSGSGKIRLGNSEVVNTNVDVSGSGSISGFKATNSADLNVSGSGTISCEASRGCEVDKSKSGSGNITVSRVD